MHQFFLTDLGGRGKFARMPRHARQTPGGLVSQALNRGTARLTRFRQDADDQAFLCRFDEALREDPLRVLAYRRMPTPWHIGLWPQSDGQGTVFLRCLTLTRPVRRHKHYHRTGSGHLYQNRFKAFAIEPDDHRLTVLRYVERNALRANLVQRCQEGPWSSLACRLAGGAVAARRLAPWPVPTPTPWVQWVQEAQTEAELEAVRQAVVRGRPYGSAGWVKAAVQALGWQEAVKPRGRPRKTQPSRLVDTGK